MWIHSLPSDGEETTGGVAKQQQQEGFVTEKSFSTCNAIFCTTSGYPIFRKWSITLSFYSQHSEELFQVDPKTSSSLFLMCAVLQSLPLSIPIQDSHHVDIVTLILSSPIFDSSPHPNYFLLHLAEERNPTISKACIFLLPWPFVTLIWTSRFILTMCLHFF